jgi:hypothetical protein
MTKSPFIARRKSLAAGLLIAVLAAFGIGVGAASSAAADNTGSISGTVYGGSSGAPLANVFVSLDLPGGNYVQFGNTDANGNYSFVGLAPASYVLDFAPNIGDNYAPQWWNNQPTLATATPIPLSTGQALTGENVTLADGATVTGQVDTATGPAPFVEVNIVDSAGNYYNEALTDNDGNYSVVGLPAGSFTAEFANLQDLNAAHQWWNSETSQATADYFTTTAGETTSGINETFSDSGTGSISGTVYAPGSPETVVANEGVAALNPDGSYAGSAGTASDGTYTIAGLAPGSYTLEFNNGFSAPTLATQYWQNEPSLASADFFPVAAGDALTGYDAHLAVGGTITGTILDGTAGNTPLSNVSVFVYQNGVDAPGFAFTDNDGNYTMSGLAPGTYDVQFQASYPSNDATQWYQDAPAESTSTPVTVTDGSTAAGINATLHAGATISGTVSGKASNGTLFPAGNSQLAVYSSDGSLVTDSVYAGDDGSYSITNLPAGSYKIHFDPQPDTTDFVPQWWKDKTTEATATAIVVKAGQTKVISPVLASTALKPVTPRITGSLKVGSTLTAKPGTWHPGTVSFGYQWSRGGVPVDGATASTYTLTNADANSTITVTVTGSEAGYTTDSVTSAQTRAITGGVLSTGTPTIAGAPTVGQVLTANPGTWGPGTVNLTYKWFRGSARIGGATSSTYALVHADAGKSITVKVTGAESGFTSATVTSSPTAVVH